MVQRWGGWYWQFGLASLLAMGGANANSWDCALAQIAPDGTLGTESSVVTPTNIDGLATERIDGGATRGANLFHSFEQFSIPTGGAAYFNNALDIQNIISRVTGGSVSNIDGLLRANGTANLFLLNPNGIIFGSNASLSIGGSFLASTASSINFASDTQFSATAPQTTPLLTISVPLGLQYGWGAGGIQVQGSGLQVRPGQTLALMGGSVSVEGGEFGILQALGGRIELGGLTGEGMVEIEGQQSEGAFRLTFLRFPDSVERADVLLTNLAFVDVAAGGGGSIAITARNIDVSGRSSLRGGLETDLGFSGAQAGDIELRAQEAINVENSFILNNVRTGAVGNGGDINITAGSLSLTNGAQLAASTFGQGDAGSVFVQANDDVSLVNGDIFSEVASEEAVGNSGGISITAGSLSLTNSAQLLASTFGQGNAGIVTIQVSNAVSFNGVSSNQISSGVQSNVETGAVGNGGGITIKARSLSLTNGSQLQTLVRRASNTLPGGRGNAGNVTIDVRDTVTISKVNSRGFGSGVRSAVENGAVGNGGDITIKAGSLFMTDGAELSTGIAGQGNGGSIFVQADGAVSLSGITTVFNTVRARAVGNAGDITIKAGSLSLTDGAQITASTSGQGDAGKVSIEARNTVTLDGEKNGDLSGVFSAVAYTAEGNGGNINIKARSLSLTDGARLSARTFGQGDAGNIQVDTADFVTLFGVSSTGFSSALVTSTAREAKGQGGEITVNTAAFRVADGAVVNAQTFNFSKGGNVTINANTFEAASGGQILTTTRSSGRAGNITLNVTDSVTLSGSDPTYADRLTEFGENIIINEGSASGLFANTAEESTGQAGDLRIATGQMIVRDGAEVAVSSEGSGAAGNLQVQARSIRLDNKAFLSSDTTAGQGNIILRSGDLVLRRGSNITTNATGIATGGNITIDTGVIAALENSDITANADEAFGGQVKINAQGIFGTEFRDQPTSESDITASSSLGPEFSGTVEINTPDVDPSRGLATLPVELVDASGLIAQTCPAGGGQGQSEFIVTGRGGLPPNSSEALSSEPVQVDWVTLNPRVENRSSPTVPTNLTALTPAPLVEAQGWVINNKGEVVLTAQVPSVILHIPWLPSTDCQALETSVVSQKRVEDRQSLSIPVPYWAIPKS